MTFAELLSLNEDVEFPIEEAKKPSNLEYDRHWVEWPLTEKHYSKKTGNRLYGYWSYRHRENAGAKYNDGTVVHHKDNNKRNNRKSNLAKITQSEHCKIDPNAAKPHKGEKCKDCGGDYYGRGYCFNCYMKHFRHGDFGDYDPKKNYSKKDR